jgi:DsbC/DsbD-like thiol-disulfide interchange protein
MAMIDTRSLAPLIAVWILAASTAAANAAASGWEETDGGRLRIVTEAWQSGMTELRGVLQIELAPGWKTYWREPGSAGIPPSVTPEGDSLTGITIGFPPPVWVDDPYGSWAGYTQPVALPLTFSLIEGALPEPVALDVFLGICKDVCIPVSHRFELPLGKDNATSIHAMTVSAAFAALPHGESDRLGIETAAWTADGELEIAVWHDHGATDIALFVSAGPDLPFSKPSVASSDAGRTVFHVQPVFDTGGAGDIDLLVTARNGGDSVETRVDVIAP